MALEQHPFAGGGLMRELHRPFNEFLASQLQPVDESDKSWIDYHVESVSERSQMRI